MTLIPPGFFNFNLRRCDHLSCCLDVHMKSYEFECRCYLRDVSQPVAALVMTKRGSTPPTPPVFVPALAGF